MADNQNPQAYRDHQATQGGGADPSSASDPLAELARLIGQNTDPFAEYGRGAVPGPAAYNAAGESLRGGDAYWDAQAARQAPGPSGPVPGGAAPPAGYAAPGYAAPDYDNAYRQPYETQPLPYPYPQADAAPAYTAVYAAPDGGERAPDFLSQPAYDQQAYEDEPAHADGSAPRRRMVVLAAAAVALVVVGTAGAFGYRALFGSSGSAPPPVIKADTAPSKIVPAAQRDAAGGKAIQDRIGERSGNERVVSREEQPMELKPQPRVVFPAGAPGTSATPAGAAAATPVSPTEPKKIRTVSIRPDQPMGLEQASAPPAPAAAAPVRTASVAAAGDAVASAPPIPVQERPAARPAAPAHANNGPLSLSPNAVAAPATAPATRTASVPPRAAAAPAGSGAYVQVSSQRSEADAQASFRALQAKYPNVLGSYSVSVQRADLGAKGTYYRAMIGPLAGADAVTLCGNLKAAGGSCIIQKN